MISALLKGGQGNQMFQLAAASALSWRNNDEAIFSFDDCYVPLQGHSANKYRNTVFQYVKDGKFEPKTYYKEFSHRYSPIPYKEGLLIDGYFQSSKYFEDKNEEIKNLFVLDDFRSEVGNKIGLHIRRGDYLKFSDIHPILSIDYYRRAMEMLGTDNEFIVVSDDISWCQQNLVGENIEYSELNDEVLDMSILASCKSVIIANSSFSWWAAYLNKNENCQVIAPKLWFGPLGPDSTDIIPEQWIKI